MDTDGSRIFCFNQFIRLPYSPDMRILSVDFANYKAFARFSFKLRDFDVLVGPNNAGKSTVLGAFRILSEGLRKATSRKAERVPIGDDYKFGYQVDLEDVPVSLENVFHNYDESEAATITFNLENKNRLHLIFPERSMCIMVPEGPRSVYQPATFKQDFPIKVSFVPVLGPVEHHEPLYLKDAARKALLTHRASRNFRNIWHHYPDNFEEFREMIKDTWPGMDIEKAEIVADDKQGKLVMFCPEDRYPREIYWAGFGFQVWCQLLTFILKAKDSTLLVIDEPDIYLHADLQRQLVAILTDLGVQIVLATHSVEIIAEVDSDCLVSINKRNKHAKRISSTKELHQVFQVLGTNANPTLTQLAKTKRVLFVEGKDFTMIAGLARQAGLKTLATRSDFAVVPIEGFNPDRVLSLAKGMELTLGAPIVVGVVLDRDYRTQEEVDSVLKKLRGVCALAKVHERKEIENYLLEINPIAAAVRQALRKRARYMDASPLAEPNVSELLTKAIDTFRDAVMAQFITKRSQDVRARNPSIDYTSANKHAIEEFNNIWKEEDGQIRVVPGKDVLSCFNELLQQAAEVTVSKAGIIAEFRKQDISEDMLELLQSLESFRKQQPISR